MTDVYISSDNIITSLGFTTGENAAGIMAGKTGIHLHEDVSISPSSFYASLIDTPDLENKFSLIDDPEKYTRFEKLAICSLKDALSNSQIDISDRKTLLILSTTKGNIDLLDRKKESKFGKERIYLWNTAGLLRNYFNFINEPVVISNACISGVQAILSASRFIRSGLFENVVINGTDIISEFVFSGFNSFKSLSTGPCRPFDRTRDGLSLGEGSGTIILTCNPDSLSGESKIVAGEGFSTNDANHISGPSRTAEGLFIAIDRLLRRTSPALDFISSHGTATLYNDEMESLAITRAGLQNVPVNGFKGSWGHTLGAAGIIESVMCIWSMKNSVLPGTVGYHEPGVTNPVNIISEPVNKEINSCLKIASGFGGCNAAMLFHRK